MWQAVILAATFVAADDSDRLVPKGAVRRLGCGAFYERGTPVAIAFSADGKRVATGALYDVRVWDVATATLIRRFADSEGSTGALAFSPDGNRLAAEDRHLPHVCGTCDVIRRPKGVPMARIWNLATGAIVAAMPSASALECSVAFSPDGKVLAGGNDERTISLWDAETGREVRRIPLSWKPGSSFHVGFLDSGRTLACTVGDGAIHFIDIDSGRESRRIESGVSSIWRALPSSDWSQVDVVGRDGVARSVNVIGGASIPRALPTKDRAQRPLAISSDGRFLAVVTSIRAGENWNSRLGVRDRAADKSLFEMEVTKDPPFCAAFAPDGTTLAVSAHGGLRLFDVPAGVERRPRTGHQGRLTAVAFTPDGKTLASRGAGDGRVKLWNTATGTEIATIESIWGAWALSPDGRFYAANPNRSTRLSMWDLATRTEAFDFDESEGEVSFATFSPDGRTLGACAADGVIRIIDVGSRTERLRFVRPTKDRLGFVFSPDGQWLAAPGPERTIVIIDASTGITLRRLRGLDDTANALAWSPDGERVAAVDGAGTATMWRARTGDVDRHWVAHSDSVGTIAFSPDARTVATSGDDHATRVWDVQAGARLAEFPGDEEGAACLAFSPDGTMLASGGDDGTILLWAVPRTKR